VRPLHRTGPDAQVTVRPRSHLGDLPTHVPLSERVPTKRDMYEPEVTAPKASPWMKIWVPLLAIGGAALLVVGILLGVWITVSLLVPDPTVVPATP